MEKETFKQTRRFYRSIFFQLFWLALIIVIGLTGITHTNQIAKEALKYFAIVYALFVLFILIYFPIIKRIGVNELIDYMTETTKPLPVFAKRSFEQNAKIGRIFFYCCLAIFAIINYFANLISWNRFIYFIMVCIIFDIAFRFVGFYEWLKNKIEKLK